MVRCRQWQDGQEWWSACLIAVEVVSIVHGQNWLTLLLLLAALRTLHGVAGHPRPQALFQGNLWWCVLLLAGEVTSMTLRNVRGDPTDAAFAKMLVLAWFGLFCSLAFMVNWRRR